MRRRRCLHGTLWRQVQRQCALMVKAWNFSDEAASEKYLGRKLSFNDTHETELANRIAAGWAAFHKNKSELCSKSYKLEDRVKLFNAVVTPVVLYGAGAWALKQSMEKRLRTAWRRMLRYVFRIHRRSASSDGNEETWVEFVRASAHRVDRLAETHGLENWIHAYRRKKWRLAGRLARQVDGRWSTTLLDWRPCIGAGRYPGRPRTRWADSLDKFVGGDWPNIACDAQLWGILEEGYVTHNE